MSILAGITGYSTVNAVSKSEFDYADGSTAGAELATLTHAIDLGANRLDKLMGAAIAIATIKPTSTDGLMMARAHLAEAMSDCDVSDEDALANTAGLESEGCDAGLEAWSSIKGYVANIIDWIKKQYTKIKRIIMKYWNKFFGDVERLKKGWTSVRDEAKTKQSGYTLDKSAKGDFDKQADCFYIEDTLQDSAKLVSASEAYKKLVENYTTAISDFEEVDVSESDIIEDGEIKPDYVASHAIAPAFDADKLKGNLGTFTFDQAKHPASIKYGKKAVMLAGRIQFVVCSLDSGDNISYSERAKADRIVICELTKTQKKKTKASVKFTDASEIEEIADANLELLTETIALKRNKIIAKIEDKMDKASKDLDSWKKNVPEKEEGDDRAAAKREAFREGVKIATEVFARVRRYGITTPIELCQEVAKVSGAHLDYAKQSLKALKKDK